MAYIYTNNLTGNDTTGDGSIALPYKSLMKGLAGATSGDEIRAAGGQWIPITGTATFTNGSTTVNTTTDLRSVISANDILTFEDGQFGFDKFHVRVNAISATTITLLTFWAGPTITTSAMSKPDAYHYNATTSNTGLESFNNANLQPNGRTDVKISGGWDATYTSNANGWTIYRTTSSGALFTSGAAPGMGNWKNELVIDKFMISGGAATPNGLLFSTQGGTGSSWALGEIAGVGQNIVMYNTTGVSFSFSPAVWSPKTSNSKFYLSYYGANPMGNSNVNSSYYTPSGSLPVSCDLEIWATSGTNSLTQNTGTPVPYCFSFYNEASKWNVVNQKIRTTTNNNVDGANANITQTTAQGGVSTIRNMEFFCNKPNVWPVNISSNSAAQIGGIGLTGPNAAKSGVTFSSAGGIGLIEFPLYTVESLNPCYAATLGATSGTVDLQTSLSRVSQVNLAPIQIQDSEGYKIVDIINNVYFKDDVNNWLRITGCKFSSSTGQTGGFDNTWKVAGVLSKPSTPFTVSFSLKVDSGTWDQIGVQYGPLASQIVTQSISPTSSFATYTVTVDPANYSDWGSFVSPIYIGLRSNMPNVFYEEPAPVAYIQSLSIV